MHMKKYLFYISQHYSFATLRPIQRVLIAPVGRVQWFFEGDNVNPDFLSQHEHRLHRIKEAFQYDPDAILAPENNLPSFFT